MRWKHDFVGYLYGYLILTQAMFYFYEGGDRQRLVVGLVLGGIVGFGSYLNRKKNAVYLSVVSCLVCGIALLQLLKTDRDLLEAGSLAAGSVAGISLCMLIRYGHVYLRR